MLTDDLIALFTVLHFCRDQQMANRLVTALRNSNPMLKPAAFRAMYSGVCPDDPDLIVVP